MLFDYWFLDRIIGEYKAKSDYVLHSNKELTNGEVGKTDSQKSFQSVTNKK